MTERDETLRDRKKRLTRKLITETATEMFLAHGFDEVKVTDIAARCGVSEKTVYNYFPTKESLLLDREAELATSIRLALGPDAPQGSPIEAAVAVIDRDLAWLFTEWERSEGIATGLATLQRFTAVVESTATLRAAYRDMTERLVQVAAESMATRAGVDACDPEPQIAADAILGLWRVHSQSLLRHAESRLPPEQVRANVSADVHRAARLIDSGLWAFSLMVQGGGSRDQVKAAAEAAQRASRQVATAVKRARDAWREHEQATRAGTQSPTRATTKAETKRLQNELRQQWRDSVREQQAEWRRATRELHEQQRRQQQSGRTRRAHR